MRAWKQILPQSRLDVCRSGDTSIAVKRDPEVEDPAKGPPRFLTHGDENTHVLSQYIWG